VTAFGCSERIVEPNVGRLDNLLNAPPATLHAVDVMQMQALWSSKPGALFPGAKYFHPVVAKGRRGPGQTRNPGSRPGPARWAGSEPRRGAAYESSPRTRAVSAIPVGVVASPPSPVSRSSGGSIRPTEAIAPTTSSGGMKDSRRASASWAAQTACTLKKALRLTHGTSTKPPTGSHTSPRLLAPAGVAARPRAGPARGATAASAPAPIAARGPISA